MKLLVIGTDISIFDSGSEARSRIDMYGRLFEELHIVVFTPLGFRNTKTEAGVFLYSTNSRFWFLRPLRAAALGKKIVRERALNALSVENPSECGIAGLYVRWSCKIPLFVQIHSDIFSPWYRRNSWKENVRFLLALIVIPRADRLRVVSKRIEDSLRARFRIHESKISVLPIFVDRALIADSGAPANLRDNFPKFRIIVLMVTRLVREKNIPLAMCAFRTALKALPGAGLVIVGDGPLRKELERKAARLGIGKNVQFEGSKSDPAPYYASSDLYLLSSNFEGYGRSVIEAAASGIPIVMTDVGVAGEIIRERETGRVIGVGDERAMAGAIIESLENADSAREMALRARRLVVSLEPKTREKYLEEYRTTFSL